MRMQPLNGTATCQSRQLAIPPSPSPAARRWISLGKVALNNMVWRWPVGGMSSPSTMRLNRHKDTASGIHCETDAPATGRSCFRHKPVLSKAHTVLLLKPCSTGGLTCTRPLLANPGAVTAAWHLYCGVLQRQQCWLGPNCWLCYCLSKLRPGTCCCPDFTTAPICQQQPT